MIEVLNISKRFGENEVLRNISYRFEKGKPNLVIGASGSGKTTLCKCIVGLHAPDAGTVSYDGRIFNQMGERERKDIRKEIGFLFQGSALFDFLNVEDNVKFPLQMFSNMSQAEMRKRADFCLERVGLKGTNTLKPAELSGGMKKRVGIARAISFNPKYLFCDEPNSGLDPQTSILIDNLIEEITEEFDITTIVITHDMNSVMEIGENIAFIHKGELMWQGTNRQILQAEVTEFVDFVYASKHMRQWRDRMRS
ncbi:MAG: ATP-binding cassette domain-containing protein [Flavobacteriales bacterium]|nr:ATP-binding cassette domain-containing protein [Flavobacteriales bacterium]